MLKEIVSFYEDRQTVKVEYTLSTPTQSLSIFVEDDNTSIGFTSDGMLCFISPNSYHRIKETRALALKCAQKVKEALNIHG